MLLLHLGSIFPFKISDSGKYWSFPSPFSTGSSFETNNQHRFIHFNHSGQSMESVNDGFSSYLVSNSPLNCTVSSDRSCQQSIINCRDRKGNTSIFIPTECYSFPASPGRLWESFAPCLFWWQRQTPLTRSDSGNSDDNYVPMNPGSSPLSACQADSPKNIYIPMSPGPHHFDFPGFSATLPARKASSASLCHRPSRLSDVTPPPIYRDLKPDRKCEILTLSFSLRACFKSALNSGVNCWRPWYLLITSVLVFLQQSQHLLIWRTMGSLMSCHLRVQSLCPGHDPCESYISAFHTHTVKNHYIAGSTDVTDFFPPLCFFRPAMNCTSSQHCRPISTQSITSTDSADSEENYVAMVGPGSWTGRLGRVHCVLCFNDPLICMHC